MKHYTTLAILGCIILSQQSTYAALSPLPGTVLVGAQGNGIIRQYSSSNGSYVGSLQLRSFDGSQSLVTRSIAYVNSELYVSITSSTASYFGRVDPLTGIVTPTPLSTGFTPTRLATRGSELVQVSWENLFVYNSSLAFTDFIMLTPPPGTYFFNEVGGIAYDAIGNAFVTSNGGTGENNRVMYWRPDGTLEGQRNFNPVPGFTIQSIDMDANNNDLFVTFQGGTSDQGFLRKYAFGAEDPLWSVPILGNGNFGTIQDIVYIPIPTPATLLPTLALSLFATRRRR
jgi:hypothetical protein